ncbi:MAG: hypothetical protein IT337_10305 [Thermomicrobiales bacterium]|nr:hypothetical protein [Thermomicrobiales bacterium]
MVETNSPNEATPRPTVTQLLERCVELKEDLSEFSRQSRFGAAFRRELARRLEPWSDIVDPVRYSDFWRSGEDGTWSAPWDFPWDDSRGEIWEGAEHDLIAGEIANFIDWFLLQYRLRDGTTIVEQFVAEHPELPESERAMLLGWRDVVDGVFEVRRRSDDALVTTNLVDELPYRVRSHRGSTVFSRALPRAFLVGRVVPVGDEWMLSGVSRILEPGERDEAEALADGIALDYPQRVFRNPAKLEQGWELQRDERRRFIAFFGSDLVVAPKDEFTERMREFLRTRLADGGQEGTGPTRERDARFDEAAVSLIDSGLFETVQHAETVAAICDEERGLEFFPDYGLLAETFANPDLADEPRRRKLVLDYATDPDISYVPLHRLAEQDPERASRVFQRVLGLPTFSWERDGETLLRANKAIDFEQPALPVVMPPRRRQGSANPAGTTRPERRRPARQTKPSARKRRGRQN